MSPGYPLSHRHSPLCLCKDCLSKINNPSSMVPPGSRSPTVFKIAHTPHKLDLIIEFPGAVSTDVDSGDDVTTKLKALVERQIGTNMTGNRDTIDSILSKYDFDPESMQTSSRSENKTEFATDACGNDLDNDSIAAITDNVDRALESTPTSEVDTARVVDPNQFHTLTCPHCDKNFYFNCSKDPPRVISLEQAETISSILVSNTRPTDSSFESSDALQTFDSSVIVTDDTTLSTFDHGTMFPSETEMNETLEYSLCNIKGYLDNKGDNSSADIHTQSRGSLRESMVNSKGTDPLTLRLEDVDTDDCLGEHWAFMKESPVKRVLSHNDPKIELRNIAEGVGVKDLNEIGMLLRNLECAQNRMDDMLAKYPLNSSLLKISCVSSQIPVDTNAVIKQTKEEIAPVGDDDIIGKEFGNSDKSGETEQSQKEITALTKKKAKKAVRSIVSTKSRKEKYKTMERASLSFVKTLEVDLGSEILLTGLMCTMFSLVFAAGALSP